MELSQRLHSILHLVQKIPQQKVSNALTTLLVLYLAYMVAGLVWQMVPTETSQGLISVNKGIQKNSVTQTTQSVDQFVALAPFGNAEKKTIVKPNPVNQPAPETRLNVTLVGLVADSTNSSSNNSVAIIESRAGQDTYGVGERVNGTQANIHQILTDRVILSVGSRFETLMMEGVEYSTVPPDVERLAKAKPAREEKPQLVEQSEVSKKIDKRQDVELAQQLREQRENLFDDPQKLLDVIRIRQFRQNGEVLGYRLSPGKKPELFKSVGLKANDLAVSINGYDLTDTQQAFTLMRELKAMTDATITVKRGDELIDIMLAL